jgi:bifunctional UDP-N-acetylglucosamine pyrophosphorylase/glucosamine-1-phosphate N-acetyltransferase
MQLFGTSGIRAVVDNWLVQLALKVGLAVGNLYGNVVVGSDTRTSGDALKHAFISGLLAGGSSCSDAGVVPTPTLAFAARGFDAAAMITASHNPPQYNGMKLLNPDGSAFDAEQRRQIEEMVANDSVSVVSWEIIKQASIYNKAVEKHIARILQDFPVGLKLKVVVDCGCGAASEVTPHLLRGLGCEVATLNCHPSGVFPRDAEPIEANLGNLIKATRERGADLGIAHDGDADRMMVVDDRGRFVSGDKLLAIFARELGAREVVTTLDASMVIDEMGFTITRTKVGDIYVSEELKKGGDFGGEPSGSWVFPGISLCPDGIYAAAQVVAMASRQKLSQLVDTVPGYPLLRGSSSGERVAMSRLEQRLTAMEPVSVSNDDGIRLNFEDGWLLVRRSGTEPKIRLTAEARNEMRVRQLYDKGLEAVRECAVAGEVGASRMRPLTHARPKVMLPMANKPILEHLLVEAIKAGIKEFIFVIGYHDEQVRKYFGNGRKWGVNIGYATQQRQFGTADAVKMVEGLVDGNFLVANGDMIISREDISNLANRNDNTLSVVEVEDTLDLGVVGISNGRVVRILEKVGSSPSRLANAGLYLFTPDIFDAISQTSKSPRGEYEITDSLQLMIDEGHSIFYQEIGYWLNISYPWDLLSANESLLEGIEPANGAEVEENVVMKGTISIGKDTVVRSGSYIVGPVVIGQGCDIGPNCYIRPCTSIGDNCRIGSAVEVKNSIVMKSSKLPHHNYVGDSIIGEACNLGSGTKIANLRLDGKNIRVGNIDTGRRKLGAIIGDQVETGINASINVGSMIGNNTYIGPGAVASGVIAPRSRLY